MIMGRNYYYKRCFFFICLFVCLFFVLLLLLLLCLRGKRLRGRRGLQQPFLGTFGAQNIGIIGDETLANQAISADGANEAVVVPVAIFK